MKLYQIQSVMVTAVYLKKDRLITQENMESYANGEHSHRPISINDDLETLFEGLKKGEKPSANIETYYLPMLTNPQMKLVDSKDTNFFSTFAKTENLSVSDAKFILSECHRRTFRIRIHKKSTTKKSTTKKSCKCLIQ